MLDPSERPKAGFRNEGGRPFYGVAEVKINNKIKNNVINPKYK